MVNDKEFACAEKFVADDQRTDGVVTSTTARIADNVSIALCQSASNTSVRM